MLVHSKKAAAIVARLAALGVLRATTALADAEVDVHVAVAILIVLVYLQHVVCGNEMLLLCQRPQSLGASSFRQLQNHVGTVPAGGQRVLFSCFENSAWDKKVTKFGGFRSEH